MLEFMIRFRIRVRIRVMIRVSFLLQCNNLLATMFLQCQ